MEKKVKAEKREYFRKNEIIAFMLEDLKSRKQLFKKTDIDNILKSFEHVIMSKIHEKDIRLQPLFKISISKSKARLVKNPSGAGMLKVESKNTVRVKISKQFKLFVQNGYQDLRSDSKNIKNDKSKKNKK